MSVSSQGSERSLICMLEIASFYDYSVLFFIFHFVIFFLEPDVESSGPVFTSHPQSQSIDEGTAFKASCTLDEADSGKLIKDWLS